MKTMGKSVYQPQEGFEEMVYVVWVGGVPFNYETLAEAMDKYDEMKDDGYDDVIIEAEETVGSYPPSHPPCYPPCYPPCNVVGPYSNDQARFTEKS